MITTPSNKRLPINYRSANILAVIEKRLLAELFQPVEKSLIVFAGANGSGKSTLVEGLELRFAFAHLDPDRAIAAGTHAAAGREAIALRDKLFKQDATFGLETTLSGKAIGGFFEKCRVAGYQIVLVYTWLDSPRACIDRIAVRVASGGHHVEDEIVRRRFFRSIVNFWINYRLVADQWVPFYNGHNRPKPVASGTKNVYDVHNRELFERYRGLVK